MSTLDVEGRQAALNPGGRQSLSSGGAGAAGAALARSSRADKVQKSWMASDADTQAATAVDAAHQGIDPAEAASVVACTTKFATAMCIVIACVKVTLYFATGQDVVRTSALDSLGDLVANCISLYTGYRMATKDKKKYPVGQGKFQSIGCLVFSTFMFSLMFGNMLGNIEGLIESEDQIGTDAITRFFWQTGGVKEFEPWRNELSLNDDKELEWKEEGEKLENVIGDFFKKSKDAKEVQMAKDWDEEFKDVDKKVTRHWLVHQAGEYENKAEKGEELGLTNKLLFCCATYKLFLWLYCILYAIPKSGSSVLKALATDKRNDFVCTYFVLAALNAAFALGDDLPISEEKVDPLISFCLSIFIMVSWLQLMVEHMQILSQEAGNDLFCDEVRQVVHVAVEGSKCHIREMDDIKVFHSSEKHTIEVTLTVSEEGTPFGEITKTTGKLENRLCQLPDVENVMIFTKRPSA